MLFTRQPSQPGAAPSQPASAASHDVSPVQAPWGDFLVSFKTNFVASCQKSAVAGLTARGTVVNDTVTGKITQICGCVATHVADNLNSDDIGVVTLDAFQGKPPTTPHITALLDEGNASCAVLAR